MDPMDELARNIVQRIEKQKEWVENLYGLIWMRLQEASPLVDFGRESRIADLKQGIDKLHCLASSATSSSLGQRHPCLSASAETLLSSSTTSSLDKSALEQFRGILDLITSQGHDVHRCLVILRSQSPTAELDARLQYRRLEGVWKEVTNLRYLVYLLEILVKCRGQDELNSSTIQSVASATPDIRTAHQFIARAEPTKIKECPEDIFHSLASSSSSVLLDELQEVSNSPLETSVEATQTVRSTSPAQKTPVVTKKPGSMSAEWVSAALIRHLEAYTPSSYWLWTLKKMQRLRLPVSLPVYWKSIFCCKAVYHLWSTRFSWDLNSEDLRPLQLELGRPAGGG